MELNNIRYRGGSPFRLSFFSAYLFSLIFLSIALTVGMAFLDPLAIFPPGKQFSGLRSMPLEYERLHKSFRIQSHQASLIVLGSSRSHLGFDLEDIGKRFGLTSYDLAVGGGSLYESYLLLRRAHQSHSLKKVILEVDFMNYRPERKQQGEIREEWFVRPAYSLLKIMLSREVFTLGLKKILGVQDGKFGMTEAGEVRVVEVGLYGNAHEVFHSWTKANGSSFRDSEVLTRARCTSQDECPAEWLRLIIAYCNEQSIDLYAFIPPYHISALELLETSEKLEIWKRSVVSEFGSVGKASGAKRELWDFAYPNSITQEPIPSVERVPMSNYFDNNHFRPNVGRKIVDALLKRPPDRSFGRKIYPKSDGS